MRLGEPFWLVVLPAALAGLAALWLVSARRTRHRWQAAFDTPWLPYLLRSVHPGRRRLKRGLIALGLALLILALARPLWGRKTIEIERTGVDLVIALDVSRSMLAADAGNTNRLKSATRAIQRLIDDLGGDRAALLAFAGEPHLAAPLTRDRTAFHRALDGAGPGMVSAQGSDLGLAITEARQCFDRSAQGPRTLLVVSDGEQLQGDAVGAAQAAWRDGVRVHTAGVGSTAGARVPTSAGETARLVRNVAGREVVSRRDEQRLQRIAAAGGGRYTRIEDADDRVLIDWFRDVAAPLARTTERRLVDEPREQFQWPLALATGLLGAGWVLSDRRRAIAAAIALLAGAPLLAANAPAAAPPEPSPWDVYNAGVDAYAQQDYLRAQEHWQDLALRTLPSRLRQPVWFQLGNAQFRLGEAGEPDRPEETAELWRRSLEAYRSALRIQPRNTATRHNHDLVERYLARLLHRLGLESFQQAADKPIDEAIRLLEAATTELDEATLLAPDEPAIRTDRDHARTALRERLLARASAAERRGDEQAQAKNRWADRQAEEQYRDALADIAQATPSSQPEPKAATNDPAAQSLDAAASQAQDRVRHKLADLLTRMGQRDQKEGQTEAEWNPDAALGHFETALDHYQQAQAAEPGHEAAERGEREVRRAIETLHLSEGQHALRQGRELLAQESPLSASSLSEALGHFEAALEMHPGSVPAQEGAAETRRLLPEALALAGQEEMQAGDRAEPGSPTEALGRYQEAQTHFERALDIQPDQAKAQQGLQELEPRLARARDRVRQAAQTPPRPGRQPASLQSLLDEVSEREPPMTGDRERQQARNRPGNHRAAQDW
ncbi:MAG TPA: VWA domain-containing protein [Verrucomicrobiota bacterium]|nr:VWA domain-containing protein [Verrucomicrobiota bacterium]HNU51135.1 VWA domain-containing protein [Verrucomicrobiota bacterium]